MEEWVAHLPLLEARSHFNVSLNTSAVSDVSSTSTNSTRAVIASLQLAQVQTLRTMHLALGVFSLALALLTVHRILSDARRAAALQVTLRKQRFNSLQNVHPAETFPLALACGVVLSQIIFVAVQGTTLHSVLSSSCRMLAMVTYPAIFAMGYITLVFGIETALRSFKFERFAPRGRWNTILCIAAVAFFLLLTWIPTIAWPMFNTCFGSLIWFPMRYDLLTLVLLLILVSSLLILAAVISIQLMRTAEVDPNERIAASRMCYYLLLTAIIYILVIPVEVQSLQENFDAALGGSRFAEASLFSSGMVISFFHLFLRTNANRLVIRPIEEIRSQSKQKRPKIRFFGPSDLEMNISGPLALQGGRRPDSRQGLIDVGPEKNRFDFDPEYFERPERAITPGSKPQSPIDPTKWPLPPDMDESKEETRKGHERNKASYSVFPTRAGDVPRLPATVYNPSKAAKGESRISKLAVRRFNRRSSVTDVSQEFASMDKPNPSFAMGRSRHDSTDSSATVQIGLRFSLAPATLAAVKYTSPTAPNIPKLNRSETETSNESLGLPLQAPSPTANADEVLLKPAVFSPLTQRAWSPAKPSPAWTPAFPLTPSQNSSAYLQAQREKVLPPAPASRAQSPLPAPAVMSGLRMNPVTPAASVAATSPTITSPTSEPTTSAPPTPVQPLAVSLVRSNSGRSAASPSPTARIPLGQGTMSRSPPPKGWL
ncbi:hypothetical protein BU25DRAFT_5500 [Macroventuria anomochaeta]|uniref:Uncharacterized protein n=1 Tax=Macroventuria anomochaeta TaxID=301207 RepID=A0ACB6SGS0_9PLEO|nr:uncharacterized protein BU25DRAFT_5500 [Macroventuria anomochaeta]KAF2633436.1 hypothetical protein BU25DRAFT_5500 [Macroventuria anomochaeta]